jgi:2-polyprenyl-3-methyl-5-hydroxy-6-metoxy-1,4-benzoquinol methylase
MESPPALPASSEQKSNDRTGKEFWDRWWEKSRLPPPIDPERRGLKNYPFRKFHKYFQKAFESHPTQGNKLIEIGCAQSTFLPYLGKYFGFEVHGIDRSEIGCERARKILEREQVPGKIYCADFFSPPENLLGQFDVIFSQGVVEHFEDTAGAVRAIARLLKADGMMVTNIPNFTGPLRAYQKILDRGIYDVQVPLDRESLALAHQDAGLKVERCEYFLPISLEVLNVASWRRRLPYWITIRTHGMISRLVWLVDDHIVSLKPNRLTSPYVNCIARRSPA